MARGFLLRGSEIETSKKGSEGEEKSQGVEIQNLATCSLGGCWPHLTLCHSWTLSLEGLGLEDPCIPLYPRNNTIVPGAAFLSHGQMMFPAHGGKGPAC